MQRMECVGKILIILIESGPALQPFIFGHCQPLIFQVTDSKCLCVGVSGGWVGVEANFWFWLGFGEILKTNPENHVEQNLSD